MVTKIDTTPVLGSKACERLNLVQRVESISERLDFAQEISNEFGDCFGEMGEVDGTTYSIEMEEGIKPVVVPTRKYPFGLVNRLKEELDRMEKLGVISKVDKSTDWVSGMAVVEKPDEPLNKGIKRHYYPMPTLEEITARMAGAQYFAKLDAISGYWQIKVDEASADLLTFSTPFGRYQFNRMPFGIRSASEIFQRIVERVIENVEGAMNSQDSYMGLFKEGIKTAGSKNSKSNSEKWFETQQEQVYFPFRRSNIFGSCTVARWNKIRPRKGEGY